MSDTTAEPDLDPAELLLHLLITLLTPMFLCVTPNLALARMAAFQSVNAYRARNQVDLILIAQIVAFGFASISSISLSFAEDIPVAMAIRLRANAAACNRACDRNRHALFESQAEPLPAQPAVRPSRRTESEPFLSPEAEKMLLAESRARLVPEPKTAAGTQSDHRIATNGSDEILATDMIAEASEIHASLPTLSPLDHTIALRTIAGLNTAAQDLTRGSAGPHPGPLTRDRSRSTLG